MNNIAELKERSEIPSPSVRIIDETSPQQLFVSHGELNDTLSFSESAFPSFTVYSGEGYAENEGRQREIGAVMARVFSLEKHGPILDVGWGSNSFISDQIHADTGVPVSLVNYGGSTEKDNPPKLEKSLGAELTCYTGDIHDISSPYSDLKDATFGAIMLNGSWAAGGENHTLQELADLTVQAHGIEHGSPDFHPKVSERLDEVIANLLGHLKPDGLMYVGSSRYAFHGAGYSFSRLPEEKLQFLAYITRLLPYHPKRITLFGISDQKFLSMITRNRTNPEARDIAEANALFNLAIRHVGSSGDKQNSALAPLLAIGGFDDLLEFTADSTKREDFLARHPQIQKLFAHELAEVDRIQNTIINQLTQGVDALPEEFWRNYPFTVDHVHTIKKATHNLVPPAIARIDAVGIEF